MNSLNRGSRPGLLTTVSRFWAAKASARWEFLRPGAADALAPPHWQQAPRQSGRTQRLWKMTLLGGNVPVFRRRIASQFPGSMIFGATLDGQSLATHTAFQSSAGARRLKFGPTKSGRTRLSFAFAEGLMFQKVLGSRSTHLLSGLGGWAVPRALCKGDVLPIGGDLICGTSADRSAAWKELESTRGTITRHARAPSGENFSESVAQTIFSSNRMSLPKRLTAWVFASRGTQHQACRRGGYDHGRGFSLGAIQVTPSGQPIILFVEQQTTGGYPKIAKRNRR